MPVMETGLASCTSDRGLAHRKGLAPGFLVWYTVALHPNDRLRGAGSQCSELVLLLGEERSVVELRAWSLACPALRRPRPAAGHGEGRSPGITPSQLCTDEQKATNKKSQR